MLTVVKMQKVKLSKLSADSVKESAHGGRENYRQADERSGAQRAHRWPEGCCRKWFAARPSGTENLYKIYAESFKDEAHLQSIVDEAQQIVTNALA